MKENVNAVLCVFLFVSNNLNFVRFFPVGGLSLLAVLSLIMDAFRIGYYVGEQSCVSVVLVVYPVIHATHTMAQVSLQSHFYFHNAIIFQQR